MKFKELLMQGNQKMLLLGRRLSSLHDLHPTFRLRIFGLLQCLLARFLLNFLLSLAEAVV
jgi:hypothetical protein